MSSLFVKPDLPQTTVQWSAEEVISVPPVTGTVVAVMAVHNWGPLGSEADGGKLHASLAEWEAVYGAADSPARRAVVQAFVGQGVSGAGGAGGVIFFRLATAAAAKATRNIQNTTPANALTLTAKFSGTRGNAISWVVEDDPLDAAKDRLRILLDGVTVASYSYVQTDIAALAAQVNARSAIVTATSVITGVVLTHGTNTLAGGNDGAVVTAAEYLAGQTALEFQNFGILSVAALTDIPIKVQIATWAKTQENEMRPIRVVFGGAAGEDVSDVITELDGNPALRDPQIVRFGVGTWHDSLLDLDLSTAEMAPRIAGILAARGERSALTRALLGGVSPVGSPSSTDDLKLGRNEGITMLRRVSNAQAEVAVSQGVTTFINTTIAARPIGLFSEPRIVGLLNRVLRQIVEWGDDIIIGDLPVTDDTRAEVRKEIGKILDELVQTGLAKPGTLMVDVSDPGDPDLADAIPFTFGFEPTRTSNYLIGHGRVR